MQSQCLAIQGVATSNIGKFMFRQRILMTFSVTGDIRFISHQDMMRVFQRSVRRAKLPVACSQGFNPRPKIALLQARGVGVASHSELMEMDFDGWVGPNQVKETLERVLPEGIEPGSVVLGNPSAHAQVGQMTYRVDFPGGVPFTEQEVRRLLDGSEILAERLRKGKTKTVDLRPVVREVRIEDSSVYMTFAVSNEGSARPEEILAALGMKPADIPALCNITRVEMELAHAS